MLVKSILQQYVKAIFDLWHRDAREESLYPALKELIEEIGKALGHEQIDITVLPKKTEVGNPDFRIWDGNARIIGYIEAKKPDVISLENLIHSEQIERYRTTFQNFILTDFLNFYLFRNEELVRTVSIARKELLISKLEPPIENVNEFKKLLEDFFSFSTPAYKYAHELARVLAYKTQFLRDQVLTTELKQNDYLKGLKEVVEKQLVYGLSDKQFVDMYAQTLTYGLFAARMRTHNPDNFTRLTAIQYIPKSIGVLYELFKFISVMADLPKSIQVIIEDIIDVLRNTDVNAILHQYRTARGDDDPIIHFYETFLAEYDPDLRERRGIYYTPLPVVKYIISAVDHLLQEVFQQNKENKDGLADPNVKILDPAAGTITFLAQAIHKALETVEQTYGSGFINQIIKTHILNNFYGFELMMAPYVIGHIKASFTLEEYDYVLQESERFPLYLTNTLEVHPPQKNRLFPLLSQEGEEALKIKQETPILVIMGNPPYSGHSANQNEWIDKLLKKDIDGLQSYYKVDGKPLDEKNPKWLQDDYVKFIRFAQWKINKHGKGIVAMITNHSYLDNATFRGMRQSLLKTFD
ncbi:MAG: N-6 DNA methylase, partial [Chlorobi bacterium]|nr:N-6 DNA methylase [Chlorobiota bacterium]